MGRSLKFDAATQTVINDHEANKLIKRLGRNEFQIPEVVDEVCAYAFGCVDRLLRRVQIA